MKKIKSILIITAMAIILLASSFAEQTKITVKGSDTMVILAQKWAELYMKQNSATSIQVTGGGPPLSENRRQGRLDLRRFVDRQDARSFQSIAMGEACSHLDLEQPAVKTEAAIEFRKARIGLASEPSPPEICFRLFAHLFVTPFRGALCRNLRRAARGNLILPGRALTGLHNKPYFMQVCDENATIMHHRASEGGTGLPPVKPDGNHRLKSGPQRYAEKRAAKETSESDSRKAD